MRRLLEDALRSGDVLDLENAILRAQDNRVASANPRRDSYGHDRLVLQCRKALISHLDACKGILKPLRRASLCVDETALSEALRRAHGAPAELRRFVRRDMAEAEALLARLQRTTRETRGLREWSDPRAAHSRFLDAHAALLPDRLVAAVCDGETERRGAVAAEEHAQRVAALRAAMDALARVLGAGSPVAPDPKAPPGPFAAAPDPPDPFAAAPAPIGVSPDVSPIRPAPGDSLVESAADIGVRDAPPRVWTRTRILAREEHVRRKDIEGAEDFDRSVFLLPMAARTSLLTRAVSRQRSLSMNETSLQF